MYERKKNMNFKDLIKTAKEEALQSSIKLQENVYYEGIIKSANFTANEKGKEIIEIKIKLTAPDVEGKMVKKTLFIDESYSEAARKIAFGQFINMVETLTENVIDENDDFEKLAVKALGLKDKTVWVKYKKKIDKNDPSKTYSQYDVYTKDPNKLHDITM